MHYWIEITLLVLLFIHGVRSDDDDEDLPHVTMEEMSIGDTTLGDNISTLVSTSTEASNFTENPFKGVFDEHDLSWLNDAIRDVAYYLRMYKFNEYDRRYNTESSNSSGKYYAGYPKPPLRSLHWEVKKYCELSFLHCMEYLNRRIKETVLRRVDDTSVVMNDQKWKKGTHDEQIAAVEADCEKLKKRDDYLALPFQGPLERFQWRTTASYYMCWYTMNGVPNLEFFGDPCDNFANCLDPDYGPNNLDFRASDTKPFHCALYSLCPDPCCPVRHITSGAACWRNELNPCLSENSADGANKQCTFERKRNTDFTDIVLNRWNVTCHCSNPGYEWESRYGMCVDINECTSKKPKCDTTREVCMNLPGSYQCACNWGYVWKKGLKRCVSSAALLAIKKERGKITPKKKDTSAKSLIRMMFNKIFVKSSSVSLHNFHFILIVIHKLI